MPEPLKIAVAGLGRMGQIHAIHVAELARETGRCLVAALADPHIDNVRRFAKEAGLDVPIFSSVEELAAANVCNATVLVTPTDLHRRHSTTLIRAGHRIILEKPLTGALESDREFSAELDKNSPDAIMLAFQRRFDPPLQYAKQLLDEGAIGRVFKVYSALEDSGPAPNGYRSGGILSDMSVHNVDEVLFLTGKAPRAAVAIGARIHSHKLTTAEEDFDDGFLYVWFEGELVAQIQVTRNHVSGYRGETIVFGEEGQINVGRFNQRPFDIEVKAYGRRGSAELIANKTFSMRDYGRPLPEFIDRYGHAYKAEVAAFIDCCINGTPFPTSHRDGLRAQEVISAGMTAIVGPDQAASVG
jgi:myo-inositol 2-dehydrogenase/D-chiro-inositol 1-dehydrogenase